MMSRTMRINYLPNGQKKKNIKEDTIMQKTKIVSFVLTAVMLVTVILAALLAINLGNAKAETGTISSQDLFSMTNTYDCTSVTDRGNYEIKYASVKNGNQVMDIPQITVLTLFY